MPAIKTLVSALETGIKNITKRGNNIPVTSLEGTLKKFGIKDQEIEASGILKLANKIAAERNEVSRKGNLLITPKDLEEAVAQRTDVFKEETAMLDHIDERTNFTSEDTDYRALTIQDETEMVRDNLPYRMRPREELEARRDTLEDAVDMNPGQIGIGNEVAEQELKEIRKFLEDPNSVDKNAGMDLANFGNKYDQEHEEWGWRGDLGDRISRIVDEWGPDSDLHVTGLLDETDYEGNLVGTTWRERLEEVVEQDLVNTGVIPSRLTTEEQHLALTEETLFAGVSVADVDKLSYRVTLYEHPALSGKYKSTTEWKGRWQIATHSPALVESKYFKEMETEKDILESWHVRGDSTSDTVFGGIEASRVFEIQSSSRTNEAWVDLQWQKYGEQKKEYLFNLLKEKNINEVSLKPLKEHMGETKVRQELDIDENENVPATLSWFGLNPEQTLRRQYDYEASGRESQQEVGMHRDIADRITWFSKPLVSQIEEALEGVPKYEGAYSREWDRTAERNKRFPGTSIESFQGLRLIRDRLILEKNIINPYESIYMTNMMKIDPDKALKPLKSEASPDNLDKHPKSRTTVIDDGYSSIEFIQFDPEFFQNARTYQSVKKVREINRAIKNIRISIGDEKFKKFVEAQNQLVDLYREGRSVQQLVKQTQRKFPAYERLEKLEPDVSIWKNAVYQELARAQEKGIKEVQFLIEPGTDDSLGWSDTVLEEIYGRILPRVIMNAARKIDAKIAWKGGLEPRTKRKQGTGEPWANAIEQLASRGPSIRKSKYLVVGLPAAAFTLPLYAEENKEESFMATAKSLGLSEEEAREYLEERIVDDIEKLEDTKPTNNLNREGRVEGGRIRKGIGGKIIESIIKKVTKIIDKNSQVPIPSEASQYAAKNIVDTLNEYGARKLTDPDYVEYIVAQTKALAQEKHDLPVEELEKIAGWGTNWKEFSRNRGYTEKEIKNYEQANRLQDKLENDPAYETDLSGDTYLIQEALVEIGAYPREPYRPPHRPPHRFLGERGAVSSDDYNNPLRVRATTDEQGRQIGYGEFPIGDLNIDEGAVYESVEDSAVGRGSRAGASREYIKGPEGEVKWPSEKKVD
ncbi:MAG: hypothetical protein CME31_08115 [Gimesia sp.]|nr:hypothetical protein [Gimesia sp.]